MGLFSSLFGSKGELRSQLSNLELYKDEDIIVYCASGMRSSNAANILSDHGFTKVYNLDGIGNYRGKLS